MVEYLRRELSVRIVEIKLFRVDLPLVDPFQHASSGLVDTLQEVVASVRTETGLIGYGEVRGNCAYVTGDTPDRIVAVASVLAPLLIGKPLEDSVPAFRSYGAGYCGQFGNESPFGYCSP